MVVTEFILLFAVLLIQGLIISKESSNIVYKSNIEKLDTINTGGRFSCVAYFLTLENFSPVNLHICLMACKWGSYTTLRCFRQHKRTVPLCYIPLSLFTLAPLGIGNHLKIIISLLDVSVNTREPSPCVPKKGALTKSDIDDIIEHVKKYYPEL